MAARNPDRTKEALARLPVLPLEDLRAEWRRLYGAQAPRRISRDLLIRAVAHRIQERAFGELRPELQRRLRQIARDVKERGEVAIAPLPRLKPGTRLLRDWRGRSHDVLVLDDGFSWQQGRYRSLSEIARAITGTRWSGPVFFGVKPKSPPARAPLRRGRGGSASVGGGDAAV